MTMTRPFLRMILHLSQIGFTDGFTFMFCTSCLGGKQRPTPAYLDRHVIRPRDRS